MFAKSRTDFFSRSVDHFPPSAHPSVMNMTIRCLEPDEEATLLAEAQSPHSPNAARARETLLAAHSPMIQRLVSGYTRDRETARDLFQQGMLGFDQAITRFDPERGTRLSTYAIWWARKFVTEYLETKTRTIKLPRKLARLASKVAFTRLQLEGEGIEPSAERIAARLQASPADVTDVLNLDSGTTLFEDSIGTPANVEAAADHAAIHKAMASLSKPEREAVELAFGFRTDKFRPTSEFMRLVDLGLQRLRNYFAVNGEGEPDNTRLPGAETV